MSESDDEVRVTVAFRIMGEDVIPDDISKIMGIEPDYSHRKGDKRVAQSGRHYSDFSEGLWSIESSADSSESVELHVREVLVRLMGRKSALDQIRFAGFRIDLLIGIVGIIGMYGFTLSEEILRLIGELRLNIDFDIYTV